MSVTETPAPDSGVSLCETCGKAILFVRTDEGATVPLDLKPPCYRPGPDGVWRREKQAAVSHFATCTNPKPFSGRNRGARG